MKRIYLLWIAGLIGGSCNLLSGQTSYSWATYPTKCQGVAVYSQPNMSVDVTGSNFANYGPQCAVSACAASGANRYFSPKYVISPNASAPDWQLNGLGLGVDWTNTSSNATVLITFSTAVCGPLQFSIYDINSGTWGGWNPVWRDKVSLTGTDAIGTTIYPSSISGCANNTVSGANSNIISAGLNTGCTNGAQLITFNSPTIKTLTIVYTSLSIDVAYGTDPDPEYIIISDITSTNCVLPIELADFSVNCNGNSQTLAWKSEEAMGIDHFEIQKSMTGDDFISIGTVEAERNGNNTQSFSWTDQKPSSDRASYKLRFVDRNGIAHQSQTLSAAMGCNPGTSFFLSPNPAHDKVNLEGYLHQAGNVSIEFYDPSGRLVHSINAMEFSGDDNHFTKELDLSFFPSGVYIVKWIASGEVLHKQLIVE